MPEKQTLEKLYDAGYTNALLQLRNHVTAFVDKPNSQTKKVLELINIMLEMNEQVKDKQP